MHAAAMATTARNRLDSIVGSTIQCSEEQYRRAGSTRRPHTYSGSTEARPSAQSRLKRQRLAAGNVKNSPTPESAGQPPSEGRDNAARPRNLGQTRAQEAQVRDAEL